MPGAGTTLTHDRHRRPRRSPIRCRCHGGGWAAALRYGRCRLLLLAAVRAGEREHCWIPERGSHRAHTVATTYVRPRSSAGRSGKPKSLPSVLDYLAPPHAPLIPALLAPAPSAPAPAGARSSPSGHPRAPARSPHVLPRAPAPGPTHALPACSPAPSHPSRLIPCPRARAPRSADVVAAATRLPPP